MAYHAPVGASWVNRHVFLRDGDWVVEDIALGGGQACACADAPTATCSCGADPGNPVVVVDPSGSVHALFPRSGSFTGLERARRTAAWEFDDVDPTAVLEGSTRLALGPGGRLTASYAVLGNVLRLATTDGGPWVRTDTPVSTEGRVGLAIDADGHHHLCAFQAGVLRHATDATGAWVQTDVDGSVPHARACAVTLAGHVHVAYHDGDQGNLRWATNATGAWVSQLVLAAALYQGTVSTAVDTQGHTHMTTTRRAFTDPTDAQDYDVEYWTNAGGEPVATNLTSGSGNVGASVLALDPAGHAHVAYAQMTPVTGPRYVTNLTGAWVDSAVTTLADVGTDFALALHGAEPRLVYGTPDQLRIAWLEGAAWSTALVEDARPHTPSLVVDADGHNHVVYGTQHRQYATDASGSWVATPLSSDATGMLPNALAISSTGALHTLFFASGVGAVYGHNEAGTWQLEPVVPSPSSLSLDFTAGQGNGFALVLDATQAPHLFTTTRALELVHLWRDTAGWRGRVLDRAERSLGPVTAAVAPDGTIHLGYLSEDAVYHVEVPPH